jgi:hypothetical protein
MATACTGSRSQWASKPARFSSMHQMLTLLPGRAVSRPRRWFPHGLQDLRKSASKEPKWPSGFAASVLEAGDGPNKALHLGCIVVVMHAGAHECTQSVSRRLESRCDKDPDFSTAPPPSSRAQAALSSVESLSVGISSGGTSPSRIVCRALRSSLTISTASLMQNPIAWPIIGYQAIRSAGSDRLLSLVDCPAGT